MIYSTTKEAIFVKRSNRFIAHVLLDGKEEVVHVKNTGRCREILQKGRTVILEKARNKNRKTKYTLIAAYKNNKLINIDSQVPNQVVYEALKEGKIPDFKKIIRAKREVTFSNSRFDIFYETDEKKGFIEVKGVTLEENNIALFPDAPTNRGTKHVKEMVKAVKEGYQGVIFFLIQMNGINNFIPNKKMDPDFASALEYAEKQGVKILAYNTYISENQIELADKIMVNITP
ncbi:DNA/RNA nuclease SfsA [Halocella sp. SP3-1]|nr:DNA/RNA nuclease SfsA [Halocella sp. SP3-1]AZO94633.1 DNA/RNA nuclease SfsA [Halocella sp. SP3-1]